MKPFISFWGRTLEDYEAMFDLSNHKPIHRVLSVADGPSTLNLEWRKAGVEVISLDPRYELKTIEMITAFELSYAANREYFYSNRKSFSFRDEQDIEALLARRKDTFFAFIEDFDQHRSRYCVGSLPTLPFDDNHFDLALCANLLFLFDDILDLPFHINSVTEMLRVAKVVKVFPLYGRSHLPTSTHLKPLLDALEEMQIAYRIPKSQYHVWQGTDSYLVLARDEHSLPDGALEV